MIIASHVATPFRRIAWFSSLNKLKLIKALILEADRRSRVVFVDAACDKVIELQLICELFPQILLL